MPKPLLTKLIATIAVGFACLFVGIIYFISARDTILLLLSAALFVFSAGKALTLYRIIKTRSYMFLIGTCTKLKNHHMRHTSDITFELDDGSSFQLTVERRRKLRKDVKYELYFEVTKISQPQNDIESPLHLLCLEEA